MSKETTVGGDFNRSSRDSAGPRDWILDLYGSFVRDFGGWIAVADLLELVQTLGVSEASGRSALSRMKSRGEIEALRKGSQRGYVLTPAAEQWFQDGNVRIMEGSSSTIGDEWVLASFTVPEQNRSIRYRIRSRLQGLGFGQVSGGLMIAPGHITDEAVRMLSRAQFTEYVELWKSQHLGFGDPADLVADAWDLDSILDAYNAYLAVADELLARPPVSDDKDAFVRYLININAWRELPFLDPGISLRHLPDGWPSAQARTKFNRLATDLRSSAWSHFVRQVSRT